MIQSAVTNIWYMQNQSWQDSLTKKKWYSDALKHIKTSKGCSLFQGHCILLLLDLVTAEAL